MLRRRLLMIAAAALVVGALALPLWEIRLVAPQYPEGLGFRIHASNVVGIKPNDLQSINGLNHYIGMKPIHADLIPELRWIPWIVIGLALAGLAAAWRASRGAVGAWLAAVVVLGTAGLWDFRSWEYDYGHNLDMENAIIVVPGMSYQPPLLGSKQLLNFTATSLPASGAFALGAAFLLGVGALVMPGGPGSRRARRTRLHPALAQGPA